MSNAGSTLKSAALGNQTPAKKGVSLFNSGKPKEFKKKELVQMFRGISSMLRAQINTADALKYYAQGLDNKIMAEALLRIREDINAGISIHEAFRRTGRFSDMIVGLIQAGLVVQYGPVMPMCASALLTMP